MQSTLVICGLTAAPLAAAAAPQVAVPPATAVRDAKLKPGFFRIVADAATFADHLHPEQMRGPNTLRAEFDQYQKNKIYLRFFVGWAAGQRITGAKLRMTTSHWGGNDMVKGFQIYQLRDGTPGDARLGWNERTLSANNAPGNFKDSNDFDEKLAQKLGVMAVGREKLPVTENDPCVFESPALNEAISADTNGYLTLMITGGGGGNACFQSRLTGGEAQPLLEITTDGKGGVDMVQPTFVVASGARQTISGYGTGMGGDHHNKIPGDHWYQNGQNLGSLSDKPGRLQEFFKTMYTDTGSNSLRLWWAIGDSVEKDLPNWERGYVETGILKAAKGAGITRFFLCSNPPKRMWDEKPSPEAGGTEPLSEAGVIDYPEYLADITATLKKKHGLELYMVTIANEDIRITPKQWPQVVKNLRKALDARGLNKVKVSGIDWPNNDDYAWTRLMAIQNDAEAWKVLDVANTHSYAMSVTEPYYQQFVQGHPGKEFWVTETGGGGPTQTSVGKDLIGHMMNDINHGVATWITHESGLAVHGDHGSIVLGYDPNGPDGDWLSISPKYHYFKQATTTFAKGTQMRRIWGTTVGDAWYPGWGKPKALASAGSRADGSWSLALLNTAESNEADAQRTFTLAVEELATVPVVEGTITRLVEGTSKEVKPTQGPTYVPLEIKTEPVQIRYGVVTLQTGPNELLTIQTRPKAITGAR